MIAKTNKSGVYYYLILILKLFVFALCVCINTIYNLQQITTIVRPEIDPFSSVILMGQFNYIQSNKNISTWSDTWARYIKNIVIATPINTPKVDLKFGRYMLYEGDKGYFSPYINMGRVIRDNENIQGILYVHDDLMISGSTLRRIGGSEWISSDFDKNNNSIIVYKNGTFASNSRDIFSGHKYFRTSWPAWTQCHSNLTNMFNDQRINPYLSEATSDNPYLTARFGQSDMLYAFFSTTEQRNAFLELLDLFAEHNLFLECAIPTLVSMMKKRFGIEVHTAKLCTDWHDLRGHLGMIKKCQKDGDYELFHPIKLNRHRDWSHYFDYVMKL